MTEEKKENRCVKCSSSLAGYRPNRKICESCAPASRKAPARSAEYQKARKVRHCSQCEVALDASSRARLCDPCRSTPNPRCKKCKKVRPLSRFARDVTRPSGYFPWCMDCSMSAQARFQNPEDELNGHVCPLCDTPIRGHKNRRFDSETCKDRVKNLKAKYDLEVSEYRRLVEATGGRCPICQNRATQWHVDHDHRTRKVTGVVCSACNVGALAMTFHDVEFVKRLLEYLQWTPASTAGIDRLVPEDQNRPSTLHSMWKRGAHRRVTQGA